MTFAANGQTTTYLAEYSQDIQWGSANLERRYGARYALTGLGGGDGGPQVSVRLDSLGVVVSTPHGRQVLDTRHLVGSEAEMAISGRGGIPLYADSFPVFEMAGVLEGEVPLSRLMNYGFPDLPDRPVQVGDSWTTHSSRPQIEAHLHLTANLTTEYRFEGWETVDGVDCVRIEGRMVGEMTTRGQIRYGVSHDYTGTLQGSLTWFFDPSTGTLVGMTGEESSDGVMTTETAETPIKQYTQIQIGLAEGR